MIIATLLFRMAENYRKRPPAAAPKFAPYSGAFLAMLMGDSLLRDMDCKASELTHGNFDAAKQLVIEKGQAYLQEGVDRLGRALDLLYGNKDVSLQQLAATFRRGDLFTYLELGELF